MRKLGRSSFVFPAFVVIGFRSNNPLDQRKKRRQKSVTSLFPGLQATSFNREFWMNEQGIFGILRKQAGMERERERGNLGSRIAVNVQHEVFSPEGLRQIPRYFLPSGDKSQKRSDLEQILLGI